MENRARFLRNCHPIFHEQSVFRGACPRKTRDWIFFRRLRAAKLGETEASEPRRPSDGLERRAKPRAGKARPSLP